ncbi:hypothetical protein OG338_25835 [Streptomyces sp. NBC_00726]|uniref:hypothetical protein n=1 Tax=Streptomyces sp. NBC_00726 TaxID=2903674 RepID=UPI00386D1971
MASPRIRRPFPAGLRAAGRLSWFLSARPATDATDAQDDRPPHERFGFRIVRRGYDRDQVDAYVTGLLGGAPPAEAVGFELVRRGYDRAGVDEVITRLHAEAARGR